MTKLRNKLGEILFATFLNINVVTTTSLILMWLSSWHQSYFFNLITQKRTREVSDKNPICLLQVYRTIFTCMVKPPSHQWTEADSVAICLFSLIKSLHMHSRKSELIIENKPHSKIKKLRVKVFHLKQSKTDLAKLQMCTILYKLQH